MDADTAAQIAALSRALAKVQADVSSLSRNAESGFLISPREITWSAGSLSAGAEVQIDVSLPMSCVIVRVVTNGAARVRLYDRAAKSTADASRASGVQPTGDHGVLLELDGGTAAEDVGFYPPAVISNRDGTGIFKMRVKNLAGSTATRSGSLWVVL